MIQKSAPILVAELFPELLRALLKLLESLSPEEWNQPTIAAGWTVHNVALHLLGDEMGILSRKRDGFTDMQASLTTWDELVRWLNERNALWVQATRRISPRLLCDLLKLAGEQANAYFRSLDPHVLGGPVSWAGPEPAPVWLDVAREFTERWHHQQHIREVVHRPGLIEPRYLKPVLATFVHALLHTYRDAPALENTCITLTIAGASGGAWSIVREAGRWQLYEGTPDQPQSVVILSEDTAWRLFTKGITRETAHRQAVLHGDPVLGEKVFEAVSIIA